MVMMWKSQEAAYFSDLCEDSDSDDDIWRSDSLDGAAGGRGGRGRDTRRRNPAVDLFLLCRNSKETARYAYALVMNHRYSGQILDQTNSR